MTPSTLVVSVPSVELLTALSEATTSEASDVQFLLWDLAGPPPRNAIDLVVVPYFTPPPVLARLGEVRTRLVQSLFIGYDGVVGHLPEGVTFANAASVHETSTAELTLALVLAAQRGIADFVRDAAEGAWRPRSTSSLADRTVLLVGYGGVGRAIEARLAPFEVNLVRVASRARVDERGTIRSTDDLPALLPTAEIVIVVVPLNEQTTGLVNADFLSRLPDGALVVNVARGRVADTDALLREAQSGRLRFALDVVDPEPLPSGHPLFEMPNVLISPHVGGLTSAALPRIVQLLERQIDCLARGVEPANVVLRT